ncbi:MAG: ABC-2 family transporter protein [Bacilli bacterium]|nr:ABC-2 family transporter protein [Bacilli bacterium]
MLMEAKNQIKIIFLSIKYSLMREMLNKVTFFSNIIFMIFNNASFIIQWIVLFSLKDNLAGYTLKTVILLWGMASATYGISRFFFKNAFKLSDTITNGKLDAYLVLPKDVLLSTITSDISVSALGDILYGYIMLCIYGLSLKNFALFTLLSICGGFVLTSISVIFSSFSFWISRSDLVSETANNLMVNFATYPDGIFKGISKIILYTIVPVGLTAYMPVQVITEFNLYSFLIILVATIVIVTLAYVVFNKGLKKYSSSNLMIARI